MPNDSLDQALARLRDFRGRFDAGAVVDRESGLTADDLDTLAAAARPPHDLEPGGSLDIDDLGNLA